MPLPNLGITEAELNAIRGIGDEFALKLRYHDERVHRAVSPRAGGPAQEMFQWVEDARVASIGSMRMEGVARNLDASLEAACQQAAFDTITAETEAPLSVAVGLVRQRLTGRELPPSAENVVRFWRDYVDERAGEHIESLRDCVDDQAQFADRCRSILTDLGFAADLDDQPEYQDSDQDIESIDDGSEPDAEFAPEDVALDEDSMGDEDGEGESTVVEMDADMDMSELEASRTRRKRPILRLTIRAGSESTSTTLPLRTSSTRSFAPKSFATAKNSRGCAHCSISSSSRCSMRPQSSPIACNAA